MNWLWSGYLVLLGLIPLILLAYIWRLRKRRKFAVRYSSLALVRAAVPQHSWLRRHLPFGIFLMALSSLVIAMGRPVTVIKVPAGQATILLTLDVSRSMCSTDILPNRLEAAKAAAISFIQRQNPNTQIGIVAFAGYAELIQPPTSDQEVLEAAVESLTTGRRTAIGSGILKALDAIAQIDPNVAPSDNGLSTEPTATPVPVGIHAPDIIVVLTDGVSNVGPLPLEAAQQAADRGVRVYTIGFGTENGSYPNCGQQFQGDQFFGGGGGFGTGGGFRRGIDEATLKQVSALTDAEYYAASSASELNTVFRNLPTSLITRDEITEISVAFTALGALLAVVGIGLALRWHPLP